jgi:hypothetical protein
VVTRNEATEQAAIRRLLMLMMHLLSLARP